MMDLPPTAKIVTTFALVALLTNPFIGLFGALAIALVQWKLDRESETGGMER